MLQRNVLRVNAVEEQADYREAVAEILRNVQHDHKVTLQDIADTIDVSLGTVSNAANKKADLNPIYLKRMGEAFGPHALDPYARLMGGRVIAIEMGGETDVLPILLAASQQIAIARSPSSEAGVVETLREQLGYLPELRRVRREADAEIARIEARRDAA